MLKKFFQNARKPKGFGGGIILNNMNYGHAPMAKWGFSHISPSENASALDIGCGGGANLAVLLDKCPQGTVTGIDYSPVSVKKSSKKNKKAINEGRCSVIQGDVSKLPFDRNTFDVITAFETVYFWQRIANAFCEVYRVLKPGGVFMICNEADGRHRADEKWAALIDGMTIYSKEQLETLLKGAGFSEVKAYDDTDKWLCVSARKKLTATE